MSQKTPLHLRAVELAASGRFHKVTDLKVALKREGYDQVDAHLTGRGIYTQLRDVIRAARGVSSEA